MSGKTRTHFPEWLPDDGDKETSRDRATIPQLHDGAAKGFSCADPSSSATLSKQ
jgi:hypothetical protein